jgi:hypothetical protein
MDGRIREGHEWLVQTKQRERGSDFKIVTGMF